jgi:hypothetical protein
MRNKPWYEEVVEPFRVGLLGFGCKLLLGDRYDGGGSCL